MQNKHEIPIPENHTAKIETVDGNVVVTFEPVQMNFTRYEFIKAINFVSLSNTDELTLSQIVEKAEKHLQSQK